MKPDVAVEEPSTRERASSADASFLPPKLVFVHIMKTAGTSLYRWLQRHYRHEDILTEATNWLGYWRLPKDVRGNKKFVRGHFGSYITNYYNHERGYRYITVLRDPVDRAISHYFHGKSAHDSGALGKVINDENLSLDAFFDHPACAAFASNFQVRNFAYDLNANYSTEKLGPARFFKGPLGQTDLQHAKDFLEDTDLVGFTERLPEFIASLSEATGFFPDHHLGRSRGYREGGALDPVTEKKIRRVNALDIELYQWAQARFGQAKPIMLGDWVRKPQGNPIDVSKHRLYHWRVKDPFFGTGWSDVQSPESVGSPPHRWLLEAERGAVHLRLKPDARYSVLFEVTRFVTAEQRNHFTLLANGIPLELTGPAPTERASNGGGLFVATLGPVHGNECELTFQVTSLRSFNMANSADPDRTLRGLALCSITFIETSSDAAA